MESRGNTIKLTSETWHLGTNVSYVAVAHTSNVCDMRPCRAVATVELTETASLSCSFDCGGASGPSEMYLCEECYKLHVVNVETVVAAGGKEVRYYFEIPRK